MGRLMMEGDYFFELNEEEKPHEYMRDAFHGQMAKHSEYGEVQIRNTPELGWHYVRWGYAGHWNDWENLTANVAIEVQAESSEAACSASPRMEGSTP